MLFVSIVHLRYDYTLLNIPAIGGTHGRISKEDMPHFLNGPRRHILLRISEVVVGHVDHANHGPHVPAEKSKAGMSLVILAFNKHSSGKS